MRELNVEAAARYIRTLRDHRDEVVDAIAADGWPEAMARAGLKLHWETWDIELLRQSIRRELAVIDDSDRHRWSWPQSVHHIWPALPGAGMTPVLIGMLLGIDQAVRPSRRGRHFAHQVARWAPWEVLEPGEEWRDTELVVASGSDETIEKIRRQLGAGGRVVGYGHRVSLVVIDDDGDAKLDELAECTAKDVVMWHQQGCFSARAVLFCGGEDRQKRFAKLLAQAIAEYEARWEAEDIGDAELATRAQNLGIAQMKTGVFCEGIGYVRCDDEAFDGSREAIHSVTVHRIAGPQDVGQAVQVAPGQLQGVAMGGSWRRRRNGWIDVLGAIGATRICPIGTLQAPPADWWHDGRPNALSWARVVSVD